MDITPSTNAAILAALATLGEADAKAIATLAGLGYSTVTKKLRGLADAGQVARCDTGDGPTRWRLVPDADEIPPAAGPANSPADAGTDQPTTDGADPAPATGAPSHAVDPDSVGAAHGDTADGPATPPDTPDQTDPAADPTPPAADGAEAPTAPRRRAGELRDQVLGVLQARPDAPFKVGEVAKALDGASAGAVANALHKLVTAGSARQVCEKPATYQAN